MGGGPLLGVIVYVSLSILAGVHPVILFEDVPQRDGHYLQQLLGGRIFGHELVVGDHDDVVAGEPHHAGVVYASRDA